jgi:hypothetical protein
VLDMSEGEVPVGRKNAGYEGLLYAKGEAWEGPGNDE